ncbi:MAG: MATE family efflux transporter, partial [Solirubrobacterales bacterium]
AHQILLQIALFIALALDSLAIAAQALVGSRLGASDTAGARAYATRVAWLSLVAGAFVAVVLAAGHNLIPQVFTSDEDVLHQIARAWWLFVLIQPLSAVVFGWDGVLMGAGDTRYLMYAMVAAAAICLPVTALAIGAGWGIVGAWSGICALNAVRFAGNGARVVGGRWAIAGAGT